MTRITQRCFLVLAFTGILLSRAQETTVSDVSDPTPNLSDPTSPSAPESSFTSVATASRESSSPSEAATSTSDSQTDNGAPTRADVSRHDTTPSTENSETPQSASAGNSEKFDSSAETTTGLSLAHSRGLFRAGLQDGKPASVVVTTEKPPSSSTRDLTTDRATDNPSSQTTTGSDSEVKSEVPDVATKIAAVTKASQEEDTTGAAASQSTETHSLDTSSKDSGQSSVPSNEDVISNSSDVGKNLTPDDMSSTTPSKVQTEDSDSLDNAKSATRKRSLNATNTLAGGTTVTISGIAGAPGTSRFTVLPSEMNVTNIDESVIETEKAAHEKKTEASSPDNLSGSSTDEMENGKILSSTVTEAVKSPYTINGASERFDANAVHSTQDEHMTSETTSVSPLHASSMLSAALSSFSEESIHPFENIDTTAQVSDVERDTTVATPRRSPELEDSGPVHDTDSSFSTVTFDPNGMTHNFPQDPDSITITPQEFHVDGMTRDAYLSRLDSSNNTGQNSPDVANSQEETAQSSEPTKFNSGNTESTDSLEREREGTAPTAQGVVPSVEPDAEEMSNRKAVQNTYQPAVYPLSSAEPLEVHSTGAPEKSKDTSPLTDESEEMLNDSPDFGLTQSKFSSTPTTDSKNSVISKDLEMNVSNDIGHTTGATSRLTSKAGHELDFSIDYEPEQSEIRPVTVTSPSESVTVPPDSLHQASSQSSPPPEVTMSGQPDTVSPDASTSPIVLPNPAPSVVNQSTETPSSVVVLPVDYLPDRNVSSDDVGKGEASLPNSTIAGVAVKTSVSVSMPLSKTPNSTANSTTSGEVTDDANLSPNISGIILPVPIDVIKDADGHPPPTQLSTEAATEASTVSTGLRIRKPKIRIGAADDRASEAPRTRKPFLAPPPKSSTTEGPPVSIFKKSRTRINSITSSTTARPLPQFSTIRIHYASRLPGMVPNGEHVFTLEPTTTTEPTTTETEEPFSDDPFTEPTQGFSMPSEDVVTLVKIAGYIVLDKGLRWNDQLINRHSPQYKEKSKYVQMQLDRLFRTSNLGSRLWKTEIDGFSGKRKSKSVAVDFFLYIAKSPSEITPSQLTSVFHDKLINSTFSRFTVDTSKTTFEILNEEPLVSTTEAPETEPEPVIPQWAIAVIVVGAASLIFVVLFAMVAILGRHHMRRRYSNKLNDEDSDRPGDWESKMAAAYENLAADTIYDAEDLHTDTYKKRFWVRQLPRKK